MEATKEQQILEMKARAFELIREAEQLTVAYNQKQAEIQKLTAEIARIEAVKTVEEKQ